VESPESANSKKESLFVNVQSPILEGCAINVRIVFINGIDYWKFEIVNKGSMAYYRSELNLDS